MQLAIQNLLIASNGWEHGSPEPLMEWGKPTKERLRRAALPASVTR